MNSQLLAFGRVDLDGTHRAFIETDSPQFDFLFSSANLISRVIIVKTKSKKCGCLLADVKRGSANKIWLDQFKQRFLQLKDGDPVDIEIVQPPPAQKVQLNVPEDFSDRDIVRLVGKPLTKGEKTAFYTFSGDPRPLTVVDTKPDGIVIINAQTEIVKSGLESEEVAVSYKNIGGLDREIRLIREAVEFPLRYPEVFEHLGVTQPRGIILYGPPGTGKTLIARALANEVGAKFYSLSGPEIFSMWYGESERKLRELFNEARNHAPAIILIDELDALTPKRENATGELEQRVVATMLTLMDGLKQLKGVVVVGTTNRVNSIDIALRREGRFGQEIHIGVPDMQGRKDILNIHTRRMPLDANVDLESIADKIVGFVGADIAALCREAAYNALRRTFSPDSFEKGQILPHEELHINQDDFQNALTAISPSGMKEFLLEIPKISWDDIGGLDEVKKLLKENIGFAISRPEVFKKTGVKPARGILLFGPPGTGKTLLAKAVASQCHANFIAVKGPEIRSKWIGEAEERIRFMFAKAREAAPCVIFFDEIDAAAPARGRNENSATDTIVNQILSEMDGIESTEGVFVIGATNRVELLDPAILRPGRFDYHIEVPLPDLTARQAIFTAQLKNKPLAEGVDIKELVTLANGYSGAEISEICRQAAWEAIRDSGFDADRVIVTVDNLKNALENVKHTREAVKPRKLGFISAQGDKK